MKNQTGFIGLIALVSTMLSLGMASCDSTGRGQNRVLREAAEIHTQSMARYDSVFAALEKEKVEVIAKIAKTPKSDERMKAYESMLRSINKSIRLLNGWDESVIGVPGLPEDDTGPHHLHKHQDKEKLGDLSDKEILALQKAYKKRLDDVVTQINGLLTTIDMYEADA